MVSTFMGLETSKRGLNTAQSALYTTGHNVANANTPGYTRQRVNLTPTDAFPTPGLNSPNIPGQLGTGVEVDSVQRIRDRFLDAQYRTQNNKLGYYNSMSESLTKMEEIMNDPTSNGLLSTMNKFWNSLEGLINNTDNTSARSVVASTAETVADTLNYYYSSLTNVQEDLRYQIGVKKDDINSIISHINDLNVSISKVEPNGLIPNDLYDQRDLLVDELSNLMNVKVTSVMPDNYGIADRAVAEGLYNIELIQEDGSSYSPKINLINVDNTGIIGTSQVVVNTDSTTGAVSNVTIGGTTLTNYKFSGELSALIESAGYMVGTTVSGTYPDMLQKLNKMTEAFANEFNTVHKQGYALGASTQSTDNFFIIDNDSTTNAAKEIKVNPVILNDASKIAAGGTSGASGDNENAHDLAAIKSKDFTNYTGTVDASLTGSFDDYYASIIGDLGVESESAQKNKKNTQTLVDSVDKNRQSVSAVSLDEEMTDMVKFQQAYNASARMITVVDEMLDKIINDMGRVGR